MWSRDHNWTCNGLKGNGLKGVYLLEYYRQILKALLESCLCNSDYHPQVWLHEVTFITC